MFRFVQSRAPLYLEGSMATSLVSIWATLPSSYIVVCGAGHNEKLLHAAKEPSWKASSSAMRTDIVCMHYDAYRVWCWCVCKAGVVMMAVACVYYISVWVWVGSRDAREQIVVSRKSNKQHNTHEKIPLKTGLECTYRYLLAGKKSYGWRWWQQPTWSNNENHQCQDARHRHRNI